MGTTVGNIEENQRIISNKTEIQSERTTETRERQQRDGRAPRAAGVNSVSDRPPRTNYRYLRTTFLMATEPYRPPGQCVIGVTSILLQRSAQP